MKTISTVESFTGGLMATKITNIPGCSKYFKGSLVSYTNEIKKQFGINISKGVINKNTALEMANKGNEYFKTDICIAFTGNAGPSVMENKKVGQVYIAINENVFELFFKGNRKEIREQAVEFAFMKIKKIYHFDFFCTYISGGKNG